MRNLVFIFLLAAIGFAPGKVFAKPDPLKRTIRADKELDVKMELISFYRALISKNPQVKKRYNELVARAQTSGEPPIIAGEKIQVVEWLVAEHYKKHSLPDPREEGEFTYLVKQPLVIGSPDNYAIKGNIIARFLVIQHNTFIEGDINDDKTSDKVENAVLTMQFLGFVDTHITAILPEGPPN